MIAHGDIHWFDFGPRNNNLQEGKRPAVVLQCNPLNNLEGYGNVIVVPLTTKERASKTYVQIASTDASGLSATSWAIANQPFTVSKSDLGERIGAVSKSELYAIKDALRWVMSLD